MLVLCCVVWFGLVRFGLDASSHALASAASPSLDFGPEVPGVSMGAAA